MLRKQNFSSLLIIILLTIALVSFIVCFFISLARYSKVEAEIASNYAIIEDYAKKSNMPLSEESVQILMDERNNFKGICTRFELALASPLNKEISEEDLDPLQFKERLIQAQKKLREDADNYNLLLPQSLGLTRYETELSESSEISLLIKCLNVLEELIYKAALSGIESVGEISFPEADAKSAAKDSVTRKTGRKRPQKTQPSAGAKKSGEKELSPEVYFDIPVSFKINCTGSRLMDFLYKLSISPFVFTVEDLDIKKIEGAQEDKSAEAKLEASLLIKAIALK